MARNGSLLQAKSAPGGGWEPGVRTFRRGENVLYDRGGFAEKQGIMLPFGNLLFWGVLAGIGFLVIGAVVSALHSAADASVRRKCRRNHRRVSSRRVGRPAITLSARCRS
ncbi:MAG: hypothetical protein RJA22_650 [Verrucomicrobiota bacterium]